MEHTISEGQPDDFQLIAQAIEPISLREVGLNWRGPVVAELPEGFHIRKLQFPEDYITEGLIMGHCLGLMRNHYRTYHSFALQDEDSLSHVTIVCWPNPKGARQIYEIRGRGNTGPMPTYRPMIQAWLDQEGIIGDDVHMPYGSLDEDAEYHEDGVIRWVITAVEGTYAPKA